MNGSSTPATPIHGRWWAGLAAAAAVVALIVGLVVVRSVNDGSPADDVIPTNDGTIPVTSDDPPQSIPTTEAPQTTSTNTSTTSLGPVGSAVAGLGCPFEIAGAPISMEPGPVDPGGPRFDAEPGQNIAHTVIGSQVAEVRVPGVTLENTEGRRLDDIELDRGPAKILLDGAPSGEQGKPFVQVRWSSETEEPCSSFTVTVDGGTVDDNRQLAIDLAQRIRLPSELDNPDLPGAEGGPVAGLELTGTEWKVASTTDGPGPVDAVVTFGDTTVTWEDGCATLSADYDLDREQGTLTLTNRSSTDPGCPTPTVAGGSSQPWSDVRDVMGAERIPAAYILDFPGGTLVEVDNLLRLGDPVGVQIVLAPA